MHTLSLIEEKVVDKNGSVFSIIAFNFNGRAVIELDNGKKYDINIAIPKGIFRFENASLQKQVEEKLKQGKIIENKALIENKPNCNELSEEEAKRKLLEIWESYGFEGFLHTTELENFQRIITSGYLFSRNKVEEFIDRANQQVIDNTNKFIFDYCRFYYYFKTPTNYRAEYKNPVILVFSKDLIYKKDIFFCLGNAASKYTFPKWAATDALPKCWDAVFERGPYQLSKYVHSERDEWTIKRIRNSEFLVKDQISIKKICKVYFKTEEDFNAAKLFSPKWLSERFCIDRDKFY